MEQVTATRSHRGYFRSSPSSSFYQYLQDILMLPLIDDPAEARRLARRAQKGVEKAAEAGVTAVIQPGGSVRDAEVIRAANRHRMAMIFTHERHFKHR